MPVLVSDACPSRPTLTCLRGGYSDPNNCSTCRCPDGFGGQRCAGPGPFDHGTPTHYQSINPLIKQASKQASKQERMNERKKASKQERMKASKQERKKERMKERKQASKKE